MRPNLRRMNYPGSQWGPVWPTNFDRLPQQTPCPGVPLGYREGPWRALSSPFARLLHRLEGALHGKSAESVWIVPIFFIDARVAYASSSSWPLKATWCFAL